ncbi:MAG TPA: insulinase family protein [Vicinamibacterales bacterium]|nr:insulinase family protein [Vicinamibacterales bacterium]
MTRARLLYALLFAIVTVAATPSAQVAAPRAGGAQAPAIPPELVLDRTLPIDPAVKSGKLPNGLTYFIRENKRPAGRVAMRLAVDAAAIQEEPDQRGLAHFLEHMAFNGTEHFKPGELVSFLESIGARFGPHVNASTSFDETIYMLEIPTDRPGYVDRGMLVLRDFAAGISLLPAEVEKERGVVLEEWRGRLGAGSRLTDKQLPVIFHGSRYAERLPIGLPEVLQKAPRERLLAFYQKWYRPDRMAVVVVGDIPAAEAEQLIVKHFGPIPAAKGSVTNVDTSVPAHKETLIDMSTDPEAQGWSVAVEFKHKAEQDQTVRGYRKSLAEGLVAQMLNLRLRDIARRPNAPFIGAQAGTTSIGRSLDLFELEAVVPEGKITEGLGALMLEAKRAQQHGFSADELNRAKAALLASYERAYRERDTAESANYANEYVRHFLTREPIPGMEFEYRIASTYLPTITAEEVTALARELITSENRVVLGVAPEKKDAPPPSVETMRAAIERANNAPVEPWTDATADRALVEKPPVPGKVTSKRSVPEIGASVLTLSNGVEVWLKPTDFKNDQIVFSAYAPGGLSLAGEKEFKSASLATAMVGVGGMGGLNPVDLSRMLSGKIAQAQPSISEYTQGISGSSTPKDLETALQLNYLAHTAPNMTPEVLELLKRRLAPSLQNRDQNPRAVFGEKVDEVNTSGHYSSKPLKMEDVNELSLETMRTFYNARFSNAADFTYFFVGAFAESEITPLLEQWVASLPSTGKKTAAARDMGVKFPAAVVKEDVKKGKEPASQTVMSFFADPGFDEFEMHRLRAATSVLNIRLREILREELGGTYGVSVGFSNSPPFKGYGLVQIQFGSSPDNVDKLVAASLKEIERLKAEGPSADDVQKVKELERRDLETNAKQNAYWLGSMQTVHLYGWDPAGIARRDQRTERLTADGIKQMFQKYFPTDRYTLVTLKPE